MARFTIITYPKCPLASIISVLGSFLAVFGLYNTLSSELVIGIVCIVIGIAFLLLAPLLAKRKRFDLWIKDLESKGILDALPTSRALCIQMYQANPIKKTLKIIEKYNPAVADELLSTLNK